MSDWFCRFCGKTLRGRTRAPSYCPKCGLNFFVALGGSSESPGPAAVRSAPNPSPVLAPALAAAAPAALPAVQVTRLSPTPAPPAARRDRRRANRIRPRVPLNVHIHSALTLQALDISSTGLLVEDRSAFKPGEICELEIQRSNYRIRLLVRVVRCVVAGGGRGSHSGIRYRTAFQFLETATPAFVALLEELSQQ